MYNNKFRFRELARSALETGVDIIISERTPGGLISMVKSYRVNAHGHFKDMPDKDNKILLPSSPDAIEQLGQALIEVAQDMRDKIREAEPV